MTTGRSPARPSTPFTVDVRRLRRAVGTRWERQVSETIEDLAVSGSAVPPGALVEADLVLEGVFGGVSITGTVGAPWSGSCRRCLGVAGGVLAVPVRELFTPSGDGEDTYPLDGDVVDLEPLMRDAVLLELPVAPLCRPDCQGLCPICGADRNLARCACEPPRDERWAALDVLRHADTAQSGSAGAIWASGGAGQDRGGVPARSAGRDDADTGGTGT